MKKPIAIRSVIPNIITILALSLGLTAIKFSLVGKFEYAIISILLAALLDAADGRIARLIDGTSKFGAELDSLADLVNFGVAPALVVYMWDLNTYGNIGWIVTLVFIICCCLRLARFNISSNDKKNLLFENFFTGVPSPAGAGILLLPIILSFSNFSFIIQEIKNINLIIILLSSFLMISKIPTYGFKKIKIKKPLVLLIMILSVLFFGFLITYTFETLFIIGCIYILLIPVSFAHHRNIKTKYNLKTKSESLISEDLL
jgi:CDP-diacylglycerol--serine O-phosphatidyltransferase